MSHCVTILITFILLNPLLKNTKTKIRNSPIRFEYWNGGNGWLIDFVNRRLNYSRVSRNIGIYFFISRRVVHFEKIGERCSLQQSVRYSSSRSRVEKEVSYCRGKLVVKWWLCSRLNWTQSESLWRYGRTVSVLFEDDDNSRTQMSISFHDHHRLLGVERRRDVWTAVDLKTRRNDVQWGWGGGQSILSSFNWFRFINRWMTLTW